MKPKPEDMPQAVRDMLARRASGRADPAIPRYLQRTLFDLDVFARSAADGIFSPPVPIVETHVVEVPDGAFRVRLFAPHRNRKLPLVLHMHGGAFVLGSIDWPDVDAKCRQTCIDAECAVVSVDYRLAPERRFPGSVEDCYAALLWCVEQADALGIDTSRIALAGESAGGNLAAALALVARDRAGPPLRAQLLEVPLVDLLTPEAHESFRLYATGFGLEAAASITRNVPLYCSAEERAHPYASPLHAADLSGLPPALLMTAEFDILRDSGEAYARRLADAGVSVDHHRGAGHNHGSPSLFQTWPPAAAWHRRCAEFLKRSLHG